MTHLKVLPGRTRDTVKDHSEGFQSSTQGSNWQFPTCEAKTEILTTALLRMTDVLSRLFCIHLFFMEEFITMKYVFFENTVMSFFCVKIY
jgi:hypothetical protein